MGFWKFSPFLAIGILVLYQVGILQAAPFRSALENPLEPATLTEDEICLLLTAVLKDYVQMKARELQQEQETEGSSLDSFRAKRCSNLSTCVLGTYTQDLNKFHTFPQTAIGVGAPGKKRVMASSLERDHSPHIGMTQDAYQSPPSAF
ncbi:calcitonin-like isoform X1 [Zalophus californianus]|uniref:Calcitonin n=2 Tax=Otariidae TaxID=9702 RepID=A0A3Q7MBG0_CALUR|nr:calcitonin-like isoform X1 [Callorhinus ursinus]XP_027972705.1 calcitonin-like isoform X1 [Eumetopias jubatus]XP_035578831.1 calcitonin-like isoform X1 [Zalophus californianus]